MRLIEATKRIIRLQSGFFKAEGSYNLQEYVNKFIIFVFVIIT